MDDEELREAVRFAIEVLRSHGVEDPAAYVGMVDRMSQQQSRRARRAVRMRLFASAH